MNNTESYSNAKYAYKVLKCTNRSFCNIRVYVGGYIAFFKDTRVYISYNSDDRCYDLHIDWQDCDEIPFSFSQMNLSNVYSSDTSNFILLNNSIYFKDGINKIEIELY